METIFNLIGLGMILVFVFVLFSIAISKIGTKPWKEEEK